MATSMTFQPGQVLFGNTGAGPYMQTGQDAGYQNTQGAGTSQPSMSPTGIMGTPNVVGPETIRATGSGPFDAAYRQNLANYAGGLTQRPGGYMGFNPTGDLSDVPGVASGGGNAPVMGGPASLLGQALGGMPFSFQPPQPQTDPGSGNQNGSGLPSGPGGLQYWLNEFRQNGSNFGLSL